MKILMNIHVNQCISRMFIRKVETPPLISFINKTLQSLLITLSPVEDSYVIKVINLIGLPLSYMYCKSYYSLTSPAEIQVQGLLVVPLLLKC